MQHLIIDIGSNTVKYSVFERQEQSRTDYVRLRHRSETVQFIRHIKCGQVSAEGLQLLLRVLDSFLHDAGSFGIPPENIRCFATASFRRLREPQTVIDAIEDALGLTVELISGEEEARLTFLGMLGNCREAQSGIMLDMGGGSTEITLFHGSRRLFSRSNPYGSLLLTERFVRGEYPTRREETLLRDYVRRHSTLPPVGASDAYAVGGSAKAIATLHAARRGKLFLPGMAAVSVDSLREDLNNYLNGNDLSEMKRRFPDRYRVIIPAMICYDEIYRLTGVTTVRVPDGGMRDGFYADRICGSEMP